MTLDLIIEAVTGIAKLLAAGLLMWAFTGFIMETIEKQYGHHDDRTVRAWEAPNETNKHYTTTEGRGEA